MPAFAFAYGSFGDLLATVQLVISIVSFLQRSGKPSTQCAETLQELKILGSDLSRLTTLPALDSTSPIAMYTASKIQEEVRQCHKMLRRFMAKISPSGLLQRLLWAVAEEKELASFRMQLIDRRVSLGLVVGLMNSGALDAIRERVDEVRVSVQLADLGINYLHAGVDDLSQQIKLYHEQLVAVINRIPRGTSDETFVVSIIGTTIRADVLIPLVFCEKLQDLKRLLRTYMRRKNDVSYFCYGMRPYFIVSDNNSRQVPSNKSLKAGEQLKLVEIEPLRVFKKCLQCRMAHGTVVSAIGWFVLM
ncbi:hypothetical protein C8R43DRAFT_94299 [Mycena crocata]|nr:hypothetical protein C8R43DRAFT_94299 [Mycena crocata]